MAGGNDPGSGAGWRVFVSHTSELREFPAGGSYVAAVERAISACGHVIVDMADLEAADLSPAQLCAERVGSCDVYLGVLGTRYGSPVRDRREVSYTELEFDTATDAGLERLVFTLDTGAADLGIPADRLIDLEFGARQQAFRRRVRESGLVTQTFSNPAMLGQLVERSLRQLAVRRHVAAAGSGGSAVVTGEIPQEPVGFQPRTDLLPLLDAPSGGVRVVRAVTGMRGVGKTHLAAAYARAKLAERWRLIGWVNAEDEAGVLAGLAEAAAGLGLAVRGTDAVAAGRAVRHWLEADGDRCLLVFDNATDPAVLRPFLPAGGRATVIITSNYRSVAALGTGVPVEVFSEAEALTFLAVRTGLADAAGATGVAAELGYLPLALAQAGAVIAAQHLSYGTYLDRLRRRPATDLLTVEEGGDYPQGVPAAVLLSVDTVRAGADGQACAAVMDLLSVLAPAGVPRSLVQAAAAAGLLGLGGAQPTLEAEAADRMLARLAGVSLVTFSVDGTTVTAHRLVMRVIRETLTAADSLTAVCLAAAQLLDDYAETLREGWHQNRAAAHDLVDQVTALAEAADRCPADEDLDKAMFRLRWWAVVVLTWLGDSPGQAVIIGERLFADQERVLGKDHPDTLNTATNLAISYRLADRLADAITLHEQAMAALERVLGPDHVDTLTSRSNLGSAYQLAGRTAEAITLQEQALAARERILGPDHPSTLASYHCLATAYGSAGRTAEAIALYERSMTDYERVLGPDHPETLLLRSNLAADYQSAGRLGDAIPLYERTLTDRQRVLGPDHPDTLSTATNLANAYRAAGRTAEADKLDKT